MTSQGECEFSTVSVQLIATGCSCRCRHCYASATGKVREPIGAAGAEEILDLLEPVMSRAEERLVDVLYDLFDHPDAAGMVRLLHRRDSYGMWIDVATNGAGIARRQDYRELLGEMKEMGSKWLQLSFHGLEETHDWFVRRRGAFRDLVAAAKAGQDAGLQLNIVPFANKRNVDELPRLGERLKQDGLDVRLGVLSWGPAGFGRELEELRVDSDDRERLREHFRRGLFPGFRTEGQWRDEVLSDDQSAFSWWNHNAFSISVDGKLDVWLDYDVPLGNLRDDDLDVIIAKYRERILDRPNRAISEEIRTTGRSERLVHLAERYAEPGGKRLYRVGTQAVTVWLQRMEADASAKGGESK